MDKITKAIWQITEEALEDESLFIVDISVSSGRTAKVTILVDGDNGVNIDDCSRISRKVGHFIEEKDLISSSYTLDVGSPGVDTPLKSERQFKKNVGRNLKVKKLDGTTVKGKLQSVGTEELILTDKKEVNKELIINYKDIDWAKVQISFNNL